MWDKSWWGIQEEPNPFGIGGGFRNSKGKNLIATCIKVVGGSNSKVELEVLEPWPWDGSKMIDQSSPY